MKLSKIIINELRKIKSLIVFNPKLKEDIIKRFHLLYHNEFCLGRLHNNTFWMGEPVQKCPLDLWVYQEILYELKPDVIIESGTAGGVTTKFLAAICQMIDKGRIITIDIKDQKNMPIHNRITYLSGSSTSENINRSVKDLMGEAKEVLVILDSDHKKEHVLEELRIYSRFVKIGGYIIVEDSNLNGHPVGPNYGPGPWEAIEEFLAENRTFIIDKSREKYFMTFNPNGYLKRIK